MTIQVNIQTQVNSQQIRRETYNGREHLILPSCRIPDDCIDKNRYPLFMARAVMRELIASLQPSRRVP